MGERGWRTARLSDIPSSAALTGFCADEYRTALAETAPHILEG
jgi:hypothetical protein